MGLHEGVQNNDIKDIVDRYGVVNYAYVLYYDNGKHSGIGQAYFSKINDAQKAAQDLQGAYIDSLPIKVQYLGNKNYNSKQFVSFKQKNYDSKSYYFKNKNQKEQFLNKAPSSPYNPLTR